MPGRTIIEECLATTATTGRPFMQQLISARIGKMNSRDSSDSRQQEVAVECENRGRVSCAWQCSELVQALSLIAHLFVGVIGCIHDAVHWRILAKV